MSNRKSFVAGVLVTLAAVFALLMLTGAVTSRTANYKSSLGLPHSQYAAMHVACSSSGGYVYVADGSRVLRSTDGGHNWQVILTSSKSERSNQ